MAAITQAVVDELAGSVDDLLAQAGAVLTGTQADYIANGEPSSVYGQLQQAGARQACRRYADDPTPFQGRAAVLAENACRPYLDSIGYGQSPEVRSPLIGGQCPGVLYRVRWSLFVPPGPATTQSVQRFGPLGLTEALEPGDIGADCGPGGFVFGRVTLLSPQGNVNLGSGCGVTVSNIVITRLDGLPDDCGSLPPEVTDPVPPGPPGPPRERFNPGPGVDVEIGVEVNPDGTINVDFGLGDVVIDPFGDGGDGDGGGPGGGGVAPPPPGPGEPGPPEETGSGGEASGEAPEGAELVGVLVEVLSSPMNANRFGNNSLEPFRGIAYVRMGYPGRLGVDMSGSAVVPPQFFHAQQRGLTAWSVSANIGFSLRTTPYYRTLPE